MAMRRQCEVQGDLVVTWAEIPRSPGHAFYDRLHKLLTESGFDGFVEATCKPYYAPRMGAPSLPPGRYFRMHMIGYFEGIDSERGIAWRCSDSLSLRAFLRLANRDKVPAIPMRFWNTVIQSCIKGAWSPRMSIQSSHGRSGCIPQAENGRQPRRLPPPFAVR